MKSVHMFTLTGALLCSFIATGVGAAHEMDKRVLGTWLLTTPDSIRTWVLDVRKHKEDSPGRVEYYGYFGANGMQFPKPVDIAFLPASNLLSLTANVDGSRLEAREDLNGFFLGTHTDSKGKSSAIRLERLAEDIVAKRKLNFPEIPKRARLDLIYLSTEDCVWCKRWEAKSRDALLNSPEGKAATFVVVKGETLMNPIVFKHYPEQFKWVYDQIGPSRGVPKFLLAIDGKVMLEAYFGSYNSIFLPALKEVVARRERAM